MKKKLNTIQKCNTPEQRFSVCSTVFFCMASYCWTTLSTLQLQSEATSKDIDLAAWYVTYI